MFPSSTSAPRRNSPSERIARSKRRTQPQNRVRTCRGDMREPRKRREGAPDTRTRSASARTPNRSAARAIGSSGAPSRAQIRRRTRRPGAAIGERGETRTQRRQNGGRRALKRDAGEETETEGPRAGGGKRGTDVRGRLEDLGTGAGGPAPAAFLASLGLRAPPLPSALLSSRGGVVYSLARPAAQSLSASPSRSGRHARGGRSGGWRLAVGCGSSGGGNWEAQRKGQPPVFLATCAVAPRSGMVFLVCNGVRYGAILFILYLFSQFFLGFGSDTYIINLSDKI